MNYRQQVAAAVQATTFHSPSSYTWFGKLTGQLAPYVKRALTPQSARNYLLFNLQARLYSDFYCQGFATPARLDAVEAPVMGATPFTEQLSAANCGRGYPEDGWEVHALEDGRAIVRKGGLELWARVQDCVAPDGRALTPGARVSLHLPKELLNISPGFYMALSDRDLIEDGTPSQVRLYWNLTPEGAVRLMAVATPRLNGADLPFRLKVLNDPARYTRCDAAVLYSRRQDYGAVSAILADLYPELLADLKPGTPVFTKPLAAGLGLAEDPGQGESYGMHRCKILAEGLLRAYEQGQKSLAGRLQVVEACFVEHGLSLDRPYLNHGSAGDSYGFAHGLHSRPAVRFVREPVTDGAADDGPGAALQSAAWLQTAAEIGERIVSEAIWHGERCNWLGYASEEASNSQDAPGRQYSALGPELYTGASGVALFLAELFAVTGDAGARRTALAALWQALDRADALPPDVRLGLHTGWAGLALVAGRVGTLLGEDGLLRAAADLLGRLACEGPQDGEFDIVSGKAGAIAVLAALSSMLPATQLLDFAVRLADELVGSAVKTAAGYSWRSPAFPASRGLTGFSHGAAGAGYALVELYAVTGEAKYRAAAEQAFNYERHWFDASSGNWPDFRFEPGVTKRSPHALTFRSSWCHGAPGIALSRLRAYEVYQDAGCRAEAVTALNTTRQQVESWLYGGSANYSLCHGLGGNAEVLLCGKQVLGQERAPDLALVHEVAGRGIARYAAQGHHWPCGTMGETPSLMLGLAGIGLFYLRLYNPAVHSCLILR